VKTDSGGSNVTSNFVNNGTLNVLSGRVDFAGGFTNNGMIHGIVSQSNGVTTIKAVAPDDFDSDGNSDILWRNGVLAEWQMSGATISQSLTPTFNGTQVSPDSSFSTEAKPTNFG
jgi:hypothetical protein